MFAKVQRRAISSSVREVVSFVLRAGNLGGGGGFGGRDRALEGTRGHQRLQRKRPAEYQAEVALSWKHAEEEFEFELRGRIDGVQPSGEGFLLEEIKTVRTLRELSTDPLHWAQAKIYAFIYARQGGFERATLRLTYVELDSDETLQFEEEAAIEELERFFDGVMSEYLEWVRAQVRWCNERDRSIQGSGFPFAAYREGQRTLAVAVYRALKQRGRLFAEAPTGIGKTISTLFPAVKAMAEGHVEKIFYATAKTSGREIAREAFAHLGAGGMKLRRVSLTARDKICFNNGERCDVTECPFAEGYYDRIKGALREALAGEAFGRPEIEALAQKHRVCPFELSLDLSVWADAIICDYNYIFDPSVALDRYFDGEKHAYAILIDEAHNLIDRAREMFSAELRRDDLEAAHKAIAEEVPACAKALAKVVRALDAAKEEEGWQARESSWVSCCAPAKLVKAVEKFLDEAELFLAKEEGGGRREELLETYFNALSFRNTAERFEGDYRSVYDSGAHTMKLLCIDPARLLQSALRRTGAAVFFSATLRPIDFFRRMLGGDLGDRELQLASPFPRENLRVLVQGGVSTRFADRQGSCDAVAASIGALVQARRGKYLIFFPSYAYLAEVLARFRERWPEVPAAAQSAAMSEADREMFLAAFRQEDGAALAGFVVMGGVFGEGIDLAGDRLIGAVVVGVGLPQICLERDLIKGHVQQSGAPGFDHAYTFPGMNRVLQAVGRVIRSEQDRGIVLLIDERFRQQQYARLLPAWWSIGQVRSAEEVSAAAEGFWLGAEESRVLAG